jgi:hypothetical protein
MNGENVKKWRLLFEDGMTNVHEEQRSGRKFFVTENLEETDNAEPGESRRFTISELHENFSSCVSLSELASCCRTSAFEKHHSICGRQFITDAEAY